MDVKMWILTGAILVVVGIVFFVVSQIVITRWIQKYERYDK